MSTFAVDVHINVCRSDAAFCMQSQDPSWVLTLTALPSILWSCGQVSKGNSSYVSMRWLKMYASALKRCRAALVGDTGVLASWASILGEQAKPRTSKNCKNGDRLRHIRQIKDLSHLRLQPLCREKMWWWRFPSHFMKQPKPTQESPTLQAL